MGHRARIFASLLKCEFEIHLRFRGFSKLASILDCYLFLESLRPQICYVFDMAYSGVLAGSLHRFWHRGKLIVDTGDAISDLARATGRTRLGCLLTSGLEQLSFVAADQLIVRGSFHQELLSDRGFNVSWIPDGVELDLFRPSLAKKHPSILMIGLVGSLIWNPLQQTCYGMELIELLSLLRDLPIRGVLIGDGSGLSYLKERAKQLRVEDRIDFLGYVPYSELPPHLNSWDICLSTQTNDVPGQVRTTGKLPLYLACDRFVLASRVGEASRILPPEMLVDYEGSSDPAYPQKLADRIRWLWQNRKLLELNGANRRLAETHFDYSLLARRLAEVVRSLL